MIRAQNERAVPGHNKTKSFTVSAETLKGYVDRLEKMDEEKKAVADDIKDIYQELKGNGYDAKAIRTIVRERKVDAAEAAEQEAILDTYRHALGMAVQAVRDGSSQRSAAKAHGVSRSYLGRVVGGPSAENVEQGPGTEILETTGAVPSGGDQGTADVTTAQPSVAANSSASQGMVIARTPRMAGAATPSIQPTVSGEAGGGTHPDDIDLTIPAHLLRKLA